MGLKFALKLDLGLDQVERVLKGAKKEALEDSFVAEMRERLIDLFTNLRQMRANILDFKDMNNKFDVKFQKVVVLSGLTSPGGGFEGKKKGLGQKAGLNKPFIGGFWR